LGVIWAERWKDWSKNSVRGNNLRKNTGEETRQKTLPSEGGRYFPVKALRKREDKKKTEVGGGGKERGRRA